ncbi:putative endoplasmic reticulum protein-folding chaperone [Botryosphaeria dothidea]|uniref:Protein ROT1 n=1 Tax=Botryosphaeria dothidea TaxID=55169 RepID=A0A8H4N4Y7_9PEZI|nr:putative endoplasmic reticulum protein-folding chaperone [Botryosphaeria dothidea]
MLFSAAVALMSAGVVAAQGIVDANLYGTWSSKSNKTLTGPGFYNPENDTMLEPELPGISYSFTSDGFWEEALYRAIANPADPDCPKGIMQWQHGTFEKASDGKLHLAPFGDGRQLLSDPCKYDAGVYTKYAQNETFKQYEVVTDSYHKIKRLNLYQFDGTPVIPLYLVQTPAEMLPTSTLTAGSKATASSTSSSKIKRADGVLTPVKRRMLGQKPEHVDADRWWWFGLGMTAVGSILYFCF